MFCNKCGNEIKENERFCSKCGNQIVNDVDQVTSSKENSSNSSNTTKKTIITVSCIVMFFAIVLGLIMNITFSNNGTITTTSSSIENTEKNNKKETSKLSLDDVQIGTKFTDFDNMNEATERVLTCAYNYITNLHPAAKWVDMKITSKDGYGRFWVVSNYVKTQYSGDTDIAGIMVWVKDINERDMGYYLSGSAFFKENGWGTPLQ